MEELSPSFCHIVVGIESTVEGGKLFGTVLSPSSAQEGSWVGLAFSSTLLSHLVRNPQIVFSRHLSAPLANRERPRIHDARAVLDFLLQWQLYFSSAHFGESVAMMS